MLSTAECHGAVIASQQPPGVLKDLVPSHRPAEKPDEKGPIVSVPPSSRGHPIPIHVNDLERLTPSCSTQESRDSSLALIYYAHHLCRIVLLCNIRVRQPSTQVARPRRVFILGLLAAAPLRTILCFGRFAHLPSSSDECSAFIGLPLSPCNIYRPCTAAPPSPTSSTRRTGALQHQTEINCGCSSQANRCRFKFPIF